MAYLPGGCKWKEIIDNEKAMLRNGFIIDRHALQIMQPVDANGTLQCLKRKFPRIDFAFGYPEWWLLYQTEVKTPSEHAQDGKRYDAEIQLDHVYEVDRNQREIGKVAIFLDGDSSANRWDFLDKLICQWREIEEKTRKDCCLESVPVPYEGCRNPVRPACGLELDTLGDSTQPFRCASHSVNYDRICKDGGCCQNPRQDGKFCHIIYEEFGDAMSSACFQCCDPPKEVGTPTPKHPLYPRIQCSSITEGTSRICKRGGCCDGSNGPWCQKLYAKYTVDEMRSICWYCCSEPRDIGRQRELHFIENEGREGVKGAENFNIHDANYEKNDDRDLDEEIQEDGKGNGVSDSWRRLENFDHVEYHPYEWMHKVKTEVCRHTF